MGMWVCEECGGDVPQLGEETTAAAVRRHAQAAAHDQASVRRYLDNGMVHRWRTPEDRESPRPQRPRLARPALSRPAQLVSGPRSEGRQPLSGWVDASRWPRGSCAPSAGGGGDLARGTGILAVCAAAILLVGMILQWAFEGKGYCWQNPGGEYRRATHHRPCWQVGRSQAAYVFSEVGQWLFGVGLATVIILATWALWRFLQRLREE